MQVWTLSTHTPINISKWLPWPGSFVMVQARCFPSLHDLASTFFPVSFCHWLASISCSVVLNGVLCFSYFFSGKSCPTCVCVCSVMSDSLWPLVGLGASVLGIIPARTLEWVAIAFSRESSQPKDRTDVSCIAWDFFYGWATGETLVAKIFFFI